MRSRFPNRYQARHVREWLGEARVGVAKQGGAWSGKARIAVYRLPSPGLAGRGRARTGGARRGWAWPGAASQGKDDCRQSPLRGEVRRGRGWRGKVRRAAVRHGEARDMPKKRQPREIWAITRARIWERDGGLCRHCAMVVALNVCHIDHIRSGKLGTNEDSNLRVLCRRCHVLRADHRHQGMIARAIRDGIIPPDWRPLVWED
jgi:5-methylcytosine-specific restriction enzyme A